MAIIVEDGSGLATAETYITVAEANAYFTARGNEAWDEVENKEAALRKATDYMIQVYHGRWKGNRMKTTQALDWPRQNVVVEDDPAWYSLVANDLVPPAVKRAAAELALLASESDLVPNLERAKSSVSIDVISINYEPSSSENPRYPSIDMMLRPYLRTSGATMRVQRT